MLTLSGITYSANNCDEDLKNLLTDLGSDRPNLTLNNEQLNQTHKELEKSEEHQKFMLKEYEDDEKRYKALQKYGYALEKVAKLLKIMPSTLEGLSTEKLEEKLQDLLPTRKSINNQMHFIFYQTMITDLLTNLMQIEKDFQEGKLTSTEAYLSVKEAKNQIKANYQDFPPILKPTLEEAKFLIKQYEESYTVEDSALLSSKKTDLIKTELSTTQIGMLTNLNSKTQTIISNVSSISEKLQNFSPEVDLSTLPALLARPKNICQFENWNPEDLIAAASELDKTASQLIDSQTEKNNQAESLKTDIATSTKQSQEFVATSKKTFADETFKNFSTRAKQNTQVINETEEAIETSSPLSQEIGSQVSETVLAQAKADEEFASQVLATPEAVQLNYPRADLEDEKNAAINLNENILAKKEVMILQLQLEDDKK